MEQSLPRHAAPKGSSAIINFVRNCNSERHLNLRSLSITPGSYNSGPEPLRRLGYYLIGHRAPTPLRRGLTRLEFICIPAGECSACFGFSCEKLWVTEHEHRKRSEAAASTRGENVVLLSHTRFQPPRGIRVFCQAHLISPHSSSTVAGAGEMDSHIYRNEC